MALVAGKPVPFGLYEVMFIPHVAGTTDLVTDTTDFVNLGYARSVQSTIEADSASTEGNDQVLYTESFNERGSGTVEQAGMNLNSLAFIWGTTAVTTGASPNQITLVTRDVGVTRPRFGLRSRSRSSRGGVFESIILNAQAIGGPNMTQGYGVFGNAQIPINYVPNEDGELIQVGEYETTPVDVPPPPPPPPPGP